MNRVCRLAAVACAVSGQAFAQDLSVGPPRAVIENAPVSASRAAYGGGVYLTVWQQGWGGLPAGADIRGVRLREGSLAPLDAAPLRICVRDEAQEKPALAYANGAFLVAWQDFGNGRDYDIRAVLVDARTGARRGAEIPVAVRPGNQARPAVAAAGSGFLVVWQEPGVAPTYCVRGVRVSSAGAILDAAPHTYAEAGLSPAACGSGAKALVTWAAAVNPPSTSGALVDAASGKVEVRLGILNSCCPDATAIAADGAGNFMTASAREPYPNPWGWPGPGAVLCSRVLADGATPEARLNYGPRLSNICARTVPNVVDGASWGKTSKSWDAGEPGGFPGTADGLWPNGFPSLAYAGRGQFLFAWVKGAIQLDRLNLDDYSVWIRGLDGGTLTPRESERRAAPGETHPSLVAGPAGEILLLSEQAGGTRRILSRRIAKVQRNRPPHR